MFSDIPVKTICVLAVIGVIASVVFGTAAVFYAVLWAAHHLAVV